MTITKFICGLHLDATTTLTMTAASTPTSSATMYVSTGGGTTRSSYAYNAVTSNWSASLSAGKYIISLEVDSSNDWFTGAITASLSSTQIFVYHGPEVPSSGHVTEAWEGSVAVAGEDPKDPWPPPSVPMPADTWFESQLHTARANLSTPKEYGHTPRVAAAATGDDAIA